jgi:hypothetical protein
MAEKRIGTVTHYFDRIGVAAVDLTDTLRVGDRVRVEGHTTKFEATIDKMQIDRKDVQEARPGQDVAVHLGERARAHDAIVKLEA